MTCRLRKLITVLFCSAILLLTCTVAAAAGIMLGDVDGDEDVSIIDATRIQRLLAEVPSGGSINEKAADVDESGDIEITDATFIQRWLADIRVPYPIGEMINEPTEAPTESPTDDGWGHEIIRP